METRGFNDYSNFERGIVQVPQNAVLRRFSQFNNHFLGFKCFKEKLTTEQQFCGYKYIEDVWGSEDKE